jgi:hypothetical protein
MNNRLRIISCLILSLIFLIGCGGLNYKEKLAAIRPNMSKDELMQIMKEPGVVRSSEIGKTGKLTEVWEYTFVTDVIEGEEVGFHFVFVDDRLIRWRKVK